MKRATPPSHQGSEAQRRSPALVRRGLVGLALLGALVAFVATRFAPPDDEPGKAGADAASATSANAATSDPAAVPTALAYGSERGTLYDVDWRVSSVVPVAGLAPQSTALDLSGVVQVTDLGREGRRRLVGVRLVSLRSASIQALEQPLYPDLAAAHAALVGQPVVLSVTSGGTIEDVYLEPSTSPLAKTTLMPLALHFGVSLPPHPPQAAAQPQAAGDSYIATEPGDFGPVVWNYTRGADGLLKLADDEQSKGRGEVRFEGALPIEIRSVLLLGARPGVENEPTVGDLVERGSSSFRAVRQSDAQDTAASWPQPDLTKLERLAPDARPSAIDETASNLAVANGLTLHDVQFMVTAFGNGQAPRKGDLVRAAGFMRAHPESCDALAAQFAAVPPKAREFIVDLLSSSGDTKAQAVMREVLATPAARQDPALYLYMLQRFSFLDSPTAESVAFVFKEWQSAKQARDETWRQASAYTLGSLAFHASHSDNAHLAQEILGSLLRDLAASRDVNEEIGLIASIGNTGMAAARAPILARVDSKDVRLRSQAAISLRKFDDEEVRRALVGLVGDEDLQVAQAALRSLDTQTIGVAELTLLAESAERGRTNVSADPALVTFVAAHSQPAEVAARILRAVDARVGDRWRLKGQIETALAALAPSAADDSASR